MEYNLVHIGSGGASCKLYSPVCKPCPRLLVAALVLA